MDNTIILTITVLLFVTILFIMARINSTRIPEKKKEKVYSKLEEMKIQAGSDDEYARRDAIIKLDNLMSKALQIRYKNVLSAGDNLKTAKTLFRKDSYQSIWEVHKLRNEIVHNDKDIGYDEAVKAYKVYKMAINRILQ
jgi:hypothetical protein